MISLGTTSLLWCLIGFSLVFGESARGIIGSPASFPLFLNMDICTPAGYPMQATLLKIPSLIFAGYQMMFAVIAPALITGAFADRVRFPAYLLFITFWLLLVYCPVAHWLWNMDGFLNKCEQHIRELRTHAQLAMHFLVPHPLPPLPTPLTTHAETNRCKLPRHMKKGKL
jgi:ammonia channel protein AmtB